LSGHNQIVSQGQWRKLGGANVALAPPHIKCGGAKVCFCNTRKSLKFVFYKIFKYIYIMQTGTKL